MPYSAAVFTRKKIGHVVDINNMTLRVGKELYKKLNIIFISIFIINKYNPSRSAKTFFFLRVCILTIQALFCFFGRCCKKRERIICLLVKCLAALV